MLRALKVDFVRILSWGEMCPFISPYLYAIILCLCKFSFDLGRDVDLKPDSDVKTLI